MPPFLRFSGARIGPTKKILWLPVLSDKEKLICLGQRLAEAAEWAGFSVLRLTTLGAGNFQMALWEFLDRRGKHEGPDFFAPALFLNQKNATNETRNKIRRGSGLSRDDSTSFIWCL
jgi:hypothetical protein